MPQVPDRQALVQAECRFEVITATTTAEAAGVVTRALRSFRLEDLGLRF